MTSPMHLRERNFCEEKKKNEQQITVVNLQCVFSDNFKRFMQKYLGVLLLNVIIILLKKTEIKMLAFFEYQKTGAWGKDGFKTLKEKTWRNIQRYAIYTLRNLVSKGTYR